MTLAPKLDANEILVHEFDYAAQTAFQAQEDRVRVYNYYLVTGGTLMAAVLLLDLQNAMHLAALGTLLSGIAILGFLSILKLAKLRIAWTESVRTMCQIKEFYVRFCDDTSLAEAFRWKEVTIPPVEKMWSVAFLMALTMGLVSAASGGGAVLVFGLAVLGDAQIWIATLVAIGIFALQLLIWLLICRRY